MPLFPAQIPLDTARVAATGTITTTSASDILATDMTLTPAAGTYLCFFTGTCWIGSPDTTHSAYVSIYGGGSSAAEVAVSDTPGYFAAFCVVGVVTVNGAQAIEGRWRRDTGGGTATMPGTRTLTIVKIG